MSPVLLETFNFYFGGSRTIAEAAAYVASIRVLPLPKRMLLCDWRSHVPMNLLESWDELSDDERMALYVMGHSATHPYECETAPAEPIMN